MKEATTVKDYGKDRWSSIGAARTMRREGASDDWRMLVEMVEVLLQWLARGGEEGMKGGWGEAKG